MSYSKTYAITSPLQPSRNSRLISRAALANALSSPNPTNHPPAPLPHFIAATPTLDPPHHLKPLTDLFERIRTGESIRALVSTPPQHGKSLTCLHALVWLLKHNPHQRHAYVTYAQQFSRDQSYIAEPIARQHIQLERNTQDRWITPHGGSVTWTSRGGVLTGRPIDGILLVDDLLKDREEANSHLIRDKAMSWLSSSAFTRMHPGASIIIVATRWHLDDPTGRLLEQQSDRWEHIHLPAINEAGEALWPEHRPLEWLKEQRRNLIPSDWSALYLGKPIADGSRIFNPPTLYDALPTGSFREANGFDAAYSTKSTADYTVTLSGRLYTLEPDNIYITRMLRDRKSPEQYIALMQIHDIRAVTWYRSSTEIGTELLLKQNGIRVTGLTDGKDKLNRAIPSSTDWNRGRILIPAGESWTKSIEEETRTFTGHNDAHDDIIDALAGLHHALKGKKRGSFESWKGAMGTQ